MGGAPLTVLAWPARSALQALLRTDSVFAIGIAMPPTCDRAAARQQIRAALREAISVLTGRDASGIDLRSVPGQPLYLAGSRIGLSISHEAGLSVAAINLRGVVGIDIMRLDAVAQAKADWPMLAHDYLGPAASQRIAGADCTQRAQVFAIEWTAREAHLKCRGLGLVEWDAARDALARHNVLPLTLPAPWLGTVVTEKSSSDF